MLLKAKSDVPHLINCSCLESTEVACTWQCDVNELIEKVTHTRTAQCHLIPNNVALTKLKRRNRLLCRTWRRLLTSDSCKSLFNECELCLVVHLSGAGSNNHLLNPRRLHRICVPKGFFERLEDRCQFFFCHFHSHICLDAIKSPCQMGEQHAPFSHLCPRPLSCSQRALTSCLL